MYALSNRAVVGAGAKLDKRPGVPDVVPWAELSWQWHRRALAALLYDGTVGSTADDHGAIPRARHRRC
jgi:hypothetical protein